MSLIKLRNRHLLIAADIAADVFGEAPQAHVVYYPKPQSLLLAPMEDEVFTTIHKTHLHLLKTRNAQGDKGLSLEEILIDHDLDTTDRDLVFQYKPGIKMLHITL